MIVIVIMVAVAILGLILFTKVLNQQQLPPKPPARLGLGAGTSHEPRALRRTKDHSLMTLIHPAMVLAIAVDLRVNFPKSARKQWY